MDLNNEFVTSRYSTFQLCHLQSKSVYLVCPSSYRKKKSRIKRHWGLVTRNNLGGLAFEWSLECEISNSSERNNENGQENAVRDQGLATQGTGSMAGTGLIHVEELPRLQQEGRWSPSAS